MNRIEYTLTAEDLLHFNLYYSAISPTQVKQRRRARLFVSVVYIALALFTLKEGSYFVATVLMVLVAAWLLFSPRWFLWRSRKHYEKHIAETAGDRLPSSIVLDLLPDGIFSSSYIGETKFRYDVVDRVVEDDGYTYIFLGKGAAFVLPHDRVPKDTVAAFVEQIQSRKNACERQQAPQESPT